jgi:RHS repeat-associated protein
VKPKVTNTYAFYSNSKRLQQMKAARAGAGLQNLTYKFDKVSNLKGITDAQYSGTCAGSISNLVYDDLHRLTSMSSAWGTRTFAYNALGNLLTNTDSGSGQYSYGSKPHAVTSANGASYSYDANGNMIDRNSILMEYDEENRLIQSGDECTVQFGYADGGARLWKVSGSCSTAQIWIGGIYEEKGGKALCHVFAGGQRLCTFEPASGGPYAMIWAPKTLWAHATETFVSATSWPFQHNRTPATVLLTTLLFLLCVIRSARRGFGARLSPAAARWLIQMRAQRPGRDAFHRVRNLPEPITVAVERDPTLVLTRQERRWFLQPLWGQALSVFMIVALVFSTTPTQVQAQTYNPVFYYYLGDHLGSSNVMTDRNGVVVEHYEYSAFGLSKCGGSGSAFQVSNRFTGQIADEETGLYYYNSRYYDPVLGRFIQADTIVPGAANPQNLNRYTYVNNNPLKYIDPSGHGGIGGLFEAVFHAEARYWSSGNTWKNIGIGAAFGGVAGAVGTAAVGHATVELGASVGYMLGPEAGNDAAFAGAIFATVVLAVYGASGGFGASNVSTAQQAYIAASAAASLASTSAAYTGNKDWANYLSYVVLAVSLAGSPYIRNTPLIGGMLGSIQDIMTGHMLRGLSNLADILGRDILAALAGILGKFYVTLRDLTNLLTFGQFDELGTLRNGVSTGASGPVRALVRFLVNLPVPTYGNFCSASAENAGLRIELTH